MVNWEPLRAKWEEENSLVNWNYQAFIFEYNLELVASNWHITQHFEPREENHFQDPFRKSAKSLPNVIILPTPDKYTPPSSSIPATYLKPDCTAFPLQVIYEEMKNEHYYSGKVNCGNLFLEDDIGSSDFLNPWRKNPSVAYPNEDIDPDSYYILIMVDPDANLANNGSWSFDEPDITPGIRFQLFWSPMRPKSCQTQNIFKAFFS